MGNEEILDSAFERFERALDMRDGGYDAGAFELLAGAIADIEKMTSHDAAIAREYDHVPADAFKTGRGAFLASLAAMPRIFMTDYFPARLDAQARENLASALTRY